MSPWPKPPLFYVLAVGTRADPPRNPHDPHETPMDLLTLFLTMCMNTELPCDDIRTEFAETPFGIMGAADLYNSGRMAIRISPDIQHIHWKVIETLLHEIAHLMVYTQNLETGTRINSGHNHKFITACKKVSMAYGRSPNHCSRGEH